MSAVGTLTARLTCSDMRLELPTFPDNKVAENIDCAQLHFVEYVKHFVYTSS